MKTGTLSLVPLALFSLTACAPEHRHGFSSEVGDHDVFDSRSESPYAREEQIEHLQRELAEIEDRRSRGEYSDDDRRRFNHVQDELEQLRRSDSWRGSYGNYREDDGYRGRRY